MKILIGIMGILCALACRLTAGEQMSLRHSFEGGFNGWTQASEQNGRGLWINNLIVLNTPEKKTLYFTSSRPFVAGWGLSDRNQNIVITSRGPHGPSLVEKFSISTGQLLQSCSGSLPLKDTPGWAKPWCDEADAEQGAAANP